MTEETVTVHKSLKQVEERLYYGNGVYMGDVLAGVDGYYVFWPELRGGYWSEGMLLEIVNHLKALNAEWDAQVQKDLGTVLDRQEPK